MAERLRKTHQDDVRAKIKSIALVTMLQRLSLDGDIDDGKGGSTRDWDPAKMRVRADIALRLLNKTVPDLSSMQLSTDPKSPFTLVIHPDVKPK